MSYKNLLFSIASISFIVVGGYTIYTSQQQNNEKKEKIEIPDVVTFDDYWE